MPAPIKPLWVLLTKVVHPIVVSARDSSGELGVQSIVHSALSTASRIEHGDVDALDIHRFELDFRGPAARGIVAEDILFRFEIFAARRIVFGVDLCAHSVPSGWTKRRSRTFLLVTPRGRALSKLCVDIFFPQIRRLHDVHVAVDDLESVFATGYRFPKAQ